MLKRRTTFIKPALTSTNKLQRVDYVLSFVDNKTLQFDPMYDVVHVGKKWFYADRDKRSYLVFDCEEVPLASGKASALYRRPYSWQH